MSKLIRKQFYIHESQDTLLKEMADKLNLTEAELVRRAIDAQLSAALFNRKDPKGWEEEKKFIQQLIREGPVEKVSPWRREEIYDR